MNAAICAPNAPGKLCVHCSAPAASYTETSYAVGFVFAIANPVADSAAMRSDSSAASSSRPTRT